MDSQHTGSPSLPAESAPRVVVPRDLATLHADDPRAVELLARWDEIPASRVHEVERHPALGPRLERMRQVEAWLRERAPADDAPEAELLYHYGRGPGARALAPEEERVVERHLSASPTDAALVEALRKRPPQPLELTPPELDDDFEGLKGEVRVHPFPAPAGASLERRTEDMRPRLLRWAPLAAAAAVLVVGIGVLQRGDDRPPFPTSPLVRGAAGDALLFPRARVLAAPGDASRAVGLYSASPLFEVAAQPSATGYRFVLSRHDGGAFSRGEEIWSARTEVPQAAGGALTEGHYTWEAWATVDGLERSLGARDFTVISDADLLARLAGEEIEDQVRTLHAGGWLTDARHRARLMPSSSERDRYLGTAPTR